MLATVQSSTLDGIDGARVAVEVHVANGLPGFTIVGLPDASCREARDRVRAAIESSRLKWPMQRVTVNLAPSGLRKVGAGLDLAVALGILGASGQIPVNEMAGLAAVGELGLDGTVRPVRGILPMVDVLAEPLVVVGSADARVAALGLGERVRPVHRLRDVVDVVAEGQPWPNVDLAFDVDEPEVVKIAAICVGLVGTTAETPALARALHHDDYFVVNIAERALWNIWFRASNPRCCTLLREAIACMHAGHFDDCENLLDRILLDDPNFAEAANQRAVLHYLTDRSASSLMACRRTLALNPYQIGRASCRERV